MTRRGRGEGGLSKRSDGRWQATYVGSDDKVHYLYGRTRKEAAAKLKAAIHDMEAGVFVAGTSPLTADYLTAWVAAHPLRDISRRRYAALIRIHAIPAIGHLELRKVQAHHLDELYATMLQGGSAPATIGQLHAVLSAAFDHARRRDHIGRSPAALVRPPKVEKRAMQILTVAQIHRFLEAIRDDELECLYTLAITTGARQGELLALRWSDIDLDAGTLSINATLTLGQRLPPKTTASIRTIHLSHIATRSVRSHRLRMAERLLAFQKRTEGDVYVFLTPVAEPLNGFHVTERSLKPLLRHAELPAIRFHDLRHVFASLLLSEGVRVDLVAQMLGHSNPATTLNIYSHLMPGDQSAAMARLDAVLGA